jgi:hypothetical protein
VSTKTLKPPKPVKPKTKCCKDDPLRCKKCPVVLKKLERMDLAERRADGRYVLSPELTKKQLKAARAR